MDTFSGVPVPWPIRFSVYASLVEDTLDAPPPPTDPDSEEGDDGGAAANAALALHLLRATTALCSAWAAHTASSQATPAEAREFLAHAGESGGCVIVGCCLVCVVTRAIPPFLLLLDFGLSHSLYLSIPSLTYPAPSLLQTLWPPRCAATASRCPFWRPLWPTPWMPRLLQTSLLVPQAAVAPAAAWVGGLTPLWTQQRGSWRRRSGGFPPSCRPGGRRRSSPLRLRGDTSEALMFVLEVSRLLAARPSRKRQRLR